MTNTTKTIRVSEVTYKKLLELKARLIDVQECNISFDDVIDELIEVSKA